MNEINSKNKNDALVINGHRRRRSTTKTHDNSGNNAGGSNITVSTINRIKRKTSLSNSDTIHATIVKKSDHVKSIDLESSEQYETIDSTMEVNESNLSLNQNHNFNHENDIEDYADRIFNYLGETYTKQTCSSLSQIEINERNSSLQSNVAPTNPSDNQIKPFLCAFCPYFARNIQEFQAHIVKHTEKNFRCLLCNCMYKYRRDCVTHMKRKHSNNVTGSISQYIQKMNSTQLNSNPTPASNIALINSNKSTTSVESKRYGCPYCSLMTKSTSSIYKHQSRKHATLPKLVHKYSTDDPTTRNLVAVLKQKSINKPNHETTEEDKHLKIPSFDESLNSNNLSSVSSSVSLNPNQIESSPFVNRHRYVVSKHITAHHIHSSNGRLSKLFQCCLCGYRAHHRSNVVRHVKNIHSHIDFNETNLSTTLINTEPISQLNGSRTAQDTIRSDPSSDKSTINHKEKNLNVDEKNLEEIPNYLFKTTVQAPLILKKANESDNSTSSFADIHLSINIFLPRKQKSISSDQTISDFSNSEDNRDDIYSDEDINEEDNGDDEIKMHGDSSQQQNLSHSSLYKPHKCRRCFYRSNWKTDMLHHIRLKHHINQATKSDYIVLDFDSALRSFSIYEKTFGKVLKNRLLLPKIDYVDCTWEELKAKLFIDDEQKQVNRQDYLSSSSIEQTASITNNNFSSLNNVETNLSIDHNQSIL